MGENGEITIRRALPGDEDEIVALLVDVMRRDPREPNREFYRWKHQQNPFGESPSWVAEMDGRIVAFRTLMRWEFQRHGADGSPSSSPLRAVRAVDTVTHAACRGRGIFRQLTLTAVQELRDEGVDFVFNTPNDSSMPGYLSMGWSVVGRMPARVQAPRISRLPRLARARTAAKIWSEPVDVGTPVADLPLTALLEEEVAERRGTRSASSPGASALATVRSEPFMRWRYGFEPLMYRGWPSADGRAAVIFRVRMRGAARELALLDVIGRRASVRGSDVRALVRQAGCDHGLSIGAVGASRGLPAKPVGPVLTARQVSRTPPEAVGQWRLSLGDVELF
ncbi:MAG TPA: GNAT family N-acetyltransferase [Actinomycetales bacterium]|jgi:GNAT superfamily N-acetyltransferase|nr:GNAT family N-acetyltransferase [Actinomycetales bacterium]